MPKIGEVTWRRSRRGNLFRHFAATNELAVVFPQGGDFRWLLINLDTDEKEFSEGWFATEEAARADLVSWRRWRDE